MKKEKIWITALVGGVAAGITIPVILTSCAKSTSGGNIQNNKPTPNNPDNPSNPDNKPVNPPQPGPGPQPPVSEPEKPNVPAQRTFDETLAKKVYNDINDKVVSLNGTIKLNKAIELLQKTDIATILKQSLGLSNAPSVSFQNEKTILINLIDNPFKDANFNVNLKDSSINYTLSNNRITITNNTKNFFSASLKVFDSNVANTLYDSLNSIVSLNRTQRLNSAQQTFQRPESANKVKNALGLTNDISINVIDLNTIEIVLGQEVYENTTVNGNDSIVYNVLGSRIQIKKSTGFFLGNLDNFTANEANKIYGILSHSVDLNNTIRLRKAQELLQTTANNNEIKNQLGLSVNVNIQVVDQKTINIMLDSPVYEHTTLNSNGCVFTVVDNKIEIKNNNGDFFLRNLNLFQEWNARNLYNTLNSITPLNKTKRVNVAQTELNDGSHRDAIKKAMNSISSITSVSVPDQNTIRISTYRDAFDNTSFDCDGIHYEMTENKVLTMTKSSGFFLENLKTFDNNTANTLYSTINGITNLNKTVMMSEASTLLSTENAKQVVKNALNISNADVNITINSNNIILTFSNDVIDNNDISVNGINYTITENKIITMNNPNGFWAAEVTTITERIANNIYDAIFGVDKIVYGSDTPQTAKAKLTRFKTEIEAVLGQNITIDNILVPNSDKIELTISNPGLFSNSNANTSGDRNSVNVAFADSKIIISKSQMFNVSTTQPVLPESIVNAYNALFGDGKLQLDEPMNSAASKLINDKQRYIKLLNDALGGQNNIQDFWIYDNDWLVIDVAEYPFNQAHGVLGKVDNNLTIQMDIGELSGKKTIALSKDPGYLFNFMEFTQDMAQGIYNAVNSVSNINGTVLFDDARNKLTKQATSQGICAAIGLPEQYFKSIDVYEDHIDINATNKFIKNGSTLSLADGINIQVIPSDAAPGQAKLTFRISRDTGLWATPEVPSTTINETIANNIYDAIFGVDKIVYGSDTPQTAKAKLTRFKTEIEAVLGNETIISDILVPNAHQIELTVNKPSLYIDSNANTSADKNSVNVSFANSKIKLTKDSMFNISTTQPVLVESVVNAYNALFGDGKLQLDEPMNSAASKLINDKQRYIKLLNDALGGQNNIQDFWIYDNDWLVINVAEYSFNQIHGFKVKVNDNLTVQMNVEEIGGKKAIVLSRDSGNLFSFMQFNNNLAQNIYDAINSIVDLNGTVLYENAQNLITKESTSKAVCAAMGLPEQYFSSIGVYQGHVDINVGTKCIPTQSTQILANGAKVEVLPYNNAPGQIRLVYKITRDSGLWKAPEPATESITTQRADSIYDSIFGDNKIAYGSDSAQTAKAKLTTLKTSIQSALGNNTKITNILVPNANQIEIAVDNPTLFNNSNADTSANRNTVNVSFNNSKIIISKNDMLNPIATQGLLSETVANVFNAIIGENKLQLNEPMDIVATKLENQKQRYIDLVNNALGGQNNIQDIWLYDAGWLVFDLQEYTFQLSSIATANINGVGVKMDVGSLGGKKTLAIYRNDGHYLFDWCHLNKSIAQNIFDSLNNIVLLNGTVSLKEARNRLTKETVNTALCKALNLPNKYLRSFEINDHGEIIFWLETHLYEKWGEENLEDGIHVEDVTTVTQPGEGMQWLKITRDGGLFTA